MAGRYAHESSRNIMTVLFFEQRMARRVIVEQIKQMLVTRFSSLPEVISLCSFPSPSLYDSAMEGLDMLILVVADPALPYGEHEEAWIHGRRMHIWKVTPESLERWVVSGENRTIMPWLLRGDIWLDRGDYLGQLQKRANEFPPLMREQKILVAFSLFLRTYLQAKQDLVAGNVLDAYSNILSALHHWAHIVLTEEGVHPELTVWRQMKQYNPGIYKLYEELTVSPETLEQRVQLVLLGCEFSVMSKMKGWCRLLMQVMQEREDAWRVAELANQPLLQHLPMDLALILRKLSKRSYIREVALMEAEDGTELIELGYVAPVEQKELVESH